jgi:lysophospholipase L1-like esterase
MKRSVVLATLVAFAAVTVARTALKWDAGLRSEYVTNPATGQTGHTGVDRDASTAAITRAWNNAPPETFRARWTGFLVVTQPGVYNFATESDDGSAVAIDGERVVDNTGDHGLVTKTGRIQLGRGSHLILVDYSQAGGLYAMTWSWGREGATMSPVPAWALWTKRTSIWRANAVRVLDPLFLIAAAVAFVVIVISAWQARGREFVGTARGRWEERRARSWNLFDWFSPRAMFRLLLPVVSLVVALLVAEGLARIAFRTVRSSGDARTFFAGRHEPIHLNNLGFRDGDVPAKGPRFRIVIIGDSITWGAGLLESERYSSQLQRFLGSGYEIVNFGIPGHNLPEHLEELDQALSIGADFILLQLYTNDFEIGEMERPRARPLLPWRGLDEWLLQSSAVYTLLSAQWPGIQEQLGLLETYYHYMHRYLKDPSSRESKAGLGMLRQFVTRAREAGVPVGLVMFPNPEVLLKHYQFDYLHDRVKTVCDQEQIHCVDLRQPFLSSFTQMKDIVVSSFDGHPSARASLVAADQILAEFRPLWQAPSPTSQSLASQMAPVAEPEKPARAPRHRRSRRVPTK